MNVAYHAFRAIRHAIASVPPRVPARAVVAIERCEQRTLLTGLDGSEVAGLPDDMKTSLYTFVGDHSGSNSEKWTMNVGGHAFATSTYGEVRRDQTEYKKGETYPITVVHNGSNRTVDGENKPDYDYRAWVDRYAAPAWTSGPTTVTGLTYFATDPSALLQKRWFGEDTDSASGKTAQLHIPGVDLDIDSDNTNGYESPDGSVAEDVAEVTSTSAKWIVKTTGDRDGDGTADVNDLTGITGARFAPVTLKFSDNLSNASASDVQITLTYGSSLRIWKTDASTDRTSSTSLVASGTAVSASSLGFNSNGTGAAVKFFVEAIGNAASAVSIGVSAQVTGSVWSGVLTDQVFARIAKLDSIKVADKPVAANNATNLAKPDDTKLFIEADNTGKVIIDVSAAGPTTATEKAKALWYIEGNDPSVRSGNFTTNPTITLTPDASNTTKRLNVTAGFDLNNNGTLEEGEVTHQVSVFIVEIHDLVVTDNDDTAHNATIPDATPIDFYIGEQGANKFANAKLKVTGTPLTAEAKKHILWEITGSSVAAPATGTFETADPIKKLTPTGGNHDFVAKVGFDDDNDGVLDANEVYRTAKIFVVRTEVAVDKAVLDILDAQKLTATLHKGTGGAVPNYKFEIKFDAANATWYDLAAQAADVWTDKARVAGKFKVRITTELGSTKSMSEEKSYEARFPDIAKIMADNTVSADADAAWQQTLAATTPTTRREQGHWITLDTNAEAFGKGPTFLGAVVDNNTGASIPVPAPTDSIANPTPLDKPTYAVAWFHTHTPTFHRAVGRAVGPSQADSNVSAFHDRPGIAYDYLGINGMSPAGHPLNSPAQMYVVPGVSRRPTP